MYLKSFTEPIYFGLPPNTALVTGDLVNALAATAEDIDTFYFSRVEDDTELFRIGNLQQVVKFIVATSILFEEVSISITGKNYIFKGVWPGKTSGEWLNDSIIRLDKP